MSDPQQEKSPLAKADDNPASFRDIAPAMEFMCWTALALIPIEYLTMGPAVTRDQSVVHLILTAAALAGAIGLRLYNWRNRSR